MTTNLTERRFLPSAAAAIRAEARADGQGEKITGVAAVYYRAGDAGTEYELYRGMCGRIVERIMPGAFDRALKEAHDVRGLFNHNPSQILGRTKSGTLRLSLDAAGLRYEIDPPDTQAGRDTLTSIKRGDVTGSSFSFWAKRVVWIQEEETDIRQIEDVDLLDVAPVTFPAYQGASVDVSGRSAEDIEALLADHKRWKESRQSEASRGEAVAVRARAVAVSAGVF